MKRLSKVLAGLLAASCCVALALPGVAQTPADKKGSNLTPPDMHTEAQVNPTADNVANLAMAHQLIQYGRKHKAPEALITAAGILAKIPTTPLDAKPTSQRTPNAPAGGSDPKKPAAEITPAALLAEAKKLGGNNPAIAALADSIAQSIETPRGRVGGPGEKVAVVPAFSTDVYTITFRGGEPAIVGVKGDGDTRLDLYIYDENGNLITSQVGPGDNCLARWQPKWTGPFTIRVVNRGSIGNRYFIWTN